MYLIKLINYFKSFLKNIQIKECNSVKVCAKITILSGISLLLK